MSGHLHRNALQDVSIAITNVAVAAKHLDAAIGELVDRSGVASVDGRTGAVDLSDLYQPIMPAEPNIADPTGGVTSDAQARDAIVAVLDLLEAHGLMAP